MEAKVRSVDVGTIKQTEIVIDDDTFIVDTANLEEASKQNPGAAFRVLFDTLIEASDLPFETMMCLPNGLWAGFSKSNYKMEAEAIAQHQRFVDFIKDGHWELCEGNDDCQVRVFGDEREQEAIQ